MPKGSKRSKPVEYHIDKYVAYEPNTGCWLWTGTLHTNGYGKLSFEGNTCLAHRKVYEHLLNVKIPEGMVLCHTCDVPCCVNPQHLFIGTVQDNEDDKRRKGRNVKGSKQGSSKLVESQVIEIKKLFTEGETNQSIAAQYNVTHQAINLIRRGINWNWLNG